MYIHSFPLEIFIYKKPSTLTQFLLSDNISGSQPFIQFLVYGHTFNANNGHIQIILTYNQYYEHELFSYINLHGINHTQKIQAKFTAPAFESYFQWQMAFIFCTGGGD